MQHPNRGRRVVLAALSACALAYVLPVQAQDPRYSEAQADAHDWLVITDSGDAAKAYSVAAKRFQSAMTSEQWQAAQKKAREGFGANKRRTLVSTQPPKPGPNVPPGDFLVIIYRAEFEKRSDATETLTLEKEADGKWRVVGYLMR